MLISETTATPIHERARLLQVYGITDDDAQLLSRIYGSTLPAPVISDVVKWSIQLLDWPELFRLIVCWADFAVRSLPDDRLVADFAEVCMDHHRGFIMPDTKTTPSWQQMHQLWHVYRRFAAHADRSHATLHDGRENAETQLAAGAQFLVSGMLMMALQAMCTRMYGLSDAEQSNSALSMAMITLVCAQSFALPASQIVGHSALAMVAQDARMWAPATAVAVPAPASTFSSFSSLN